MVGPAKPLHRKDPPMDTVTVYVSIGNSDDKLPQREWSDFAEEFANVIAGLALRVHGVWFSEPSAPFQNACVCAEVCPVDVNDLKAALTATREEFRQESVAWAVVSKTEFI